MIKKIEIPTYSLLHTCFAKQDYADAFRFEVDKPSLTIEEVVESFFSTTPKWIIWLMNFRDWIAQFLKLKTQKQMERPEFHQIQLTPGTQLGIFEIMKKTDREVIMGADDTHLNFRVSILIEPQSEQRTAIVVSTIVEIHNWIGQFYFGIVKYFHYFVVKSLCRTMQRHLNKR